jgi:hypothetical protein
LAVHPSEPVLASVGLDRFLRLHSTHSRQLLAKVYCKTLPTGASQPRLLLPLAQAHAFPALSPHILRQWTLKVCQPQVD